MDNTDFEHLLERLIAATRPPRGRFSAHDTWPLLEKRLAAARRKRRYTLWLRTTGIAAGIALCLLSGRLAWQLWETEAATIRISTQAETRTVQLPDETMVTLNRYSTLTYPKRFGEEQRQVELQGEAYFEVAKDTCRPFSVLAESVQVQVLGTHFNVEAYASDEEIKTTLLEGRVAVSTPGTGQTLTLAPNESAVYNKSKGRLVQTTAPNAANEILWSQGILYFSQEPLQEIVRQLSNAFQREIRIDDRELREYRMTATFKTSESLDDILDLLQATGKFTYHIEGNNYVITTRHTDLQ